MIDLGIQHYCFGVEFLQTNGCVFVLQTKYTKSWSERFKMKDGKTTSTPNISYKHELHLEFCGQLYL
jgi:hypothetical protein